MSVVPARLATRHSQKHSRAPLHPPPPLCLSMGTGSQQRSMHLCLQQQRTKHTTRSVRLHRHRHRLRAQPFPIVRCACRGKMGGGGVKRGCGESEEGKGQWGRGSGCCRGGQGQCGMSSVVHEAEASYTRGQLGAARMRPPSGTRRFIVTWSIRRLENLSAIRTVYVATGLSPT